MTQVTQAPAKANAIWKELLNAYEGLCGKPSA